MRIYRVASSLGPKFSVPQPHGLDLKSAQRHLSIIKDDLGDLPGMDTMRIEYADSEIWPHEWKELA